MRFVLVGCGLWGRVILRELVNLGNDVLVVEPNPENAAKAAKLGAAKVCASLSKVGLHDGIVIATPASSHFDIIRSLDALGNEAPIFCEKPLVASASDAKSLLKRDGAPLYVMHIWRYHSGIIKLRELFDLGLVGELTQFKSFRANWTSPRKDIDTLLNLAPHDLSILQYLLGSIPPVRFSAVERIRKEIVGCLTILGDQNGPLCLIEVSNRYAQKHREVRLHGAEGVLVLPNDVDGNIQLIQEGGTILAENIKQIPYAKKSAMEQQLREIMRYLETGDDRKLCSVGSGVEVVCILESIREIAKENS